jgi:hypothetical protein
MAILKKPLAVLLATLIVSAAPGAASFAETYHAPMNSVPRGFLGIQIVDQIYWGQGSSALIADRTLSTDKHESILCGGQTSVPCDLKALHADAIRANIILPKCAMATEENCIEGLSLYKAGTTPVPAEYIRSVGGSTIPADPALGLPRGGTSSLWNAPGVANSSGATTYSVMAQLDLSRNSSQKGFSASAVSIMVMPYSESSVPHGQPIIWQESSLADGTHQIGSSGGNPDCAWVETNLCGLIQDFSDGTRVKVDLRLTKQIGGWFKGRMQDSEIAVSNFSNTASHVSVDGLYSKVPQFFTLLDRENGSAEHKMMVGLDRGAHPQGPGGGGTTSTMADQRTGFLWVDKFRSLAKDTAAGVSTIWSAGTIPSSNGNCLSDTSRVLGIVSTNAMVYEGKAPAFDGKSLSYNVAGMHYLPDGKSVVEGTYDLVMRSDVARCLYGFTSAPVSATVAIVSTDGENKVATTTVKESKDGWLKLSASGFTFSENKISARITQPQASSAKKTTITCVSIKNKKLTTKVTAVAPKCPTGYKKKA